MAVVTASTCLAAMAKETADVDAISSSGLSCCPACVAMETAVANRQIMLTKRV